MRQQKYEQALKEVRDLLEEGERKDMPLFYASYAIDVINKALQRPSASDMTDEERGASIARDVANNHSGY